MEVYGGWSSLTGESWNTNVAVALAMVNHDISMSPGRSRSLQDEILV